MLYLGHFYAFFVLVFQSVTPRKILEVNPVSRGVWMATEMTAILVMTPRSLIFVHLVLRQDKTFQDEVEREKWHTLSISFTNYAIYS